MTYDELLKGMFPDLNPEVDDLFLLEANQIATLPDRAPRRQLAAVLHAHPRIRRFLVARHPPIRGFTEQLLSEFGPALGRDLVDAESALLWEIADWIVYQREPSSYDLGAGVDWDVGAVTQAADLNGKVVIDAGAGTGRVAFAVAPTARHVFAVEPVATLRAFIREKATRLGLDNIYVLDGLLHAIPLPRASADVLVTCQAVGWDLTAEMVEIERVVKPGGAAMHLFGASAAAGPDNPLHEPLVAHGYKAHMYESGHIRMLRYSKQI